MSSLSDLSLRAISLLIVDDHPIFRAGLCQQLIVGPQRISIAGEAENGLVACEMVEALRPDAVLMDYHMPVMSGLEATAKIKKDFPETKVVLFSATSDAVQVRETIKAGANGYLLKTASPSELRQAIVAVMGGTTVITPNVALLAEDRNTSAGPENSLGLSKREIQILELAARGITNKQIGEELNLSNRTVEVHMHNVFIKLGVSSRTEAVTKAIRDGSIRLP